MPSKLSTLREMCLEKTARLMKSSYWNPELPLSHNPFASLPSTIIDTLIIYVVRASASEELKSSNLQLLLTSGRVRELILDARENVCVGEVSMDDYDLHKILTYLLPSSRYLITLKLRNPWCEKVCSPMATPALNRLLSEALNIRHVESYIAFDLRVLCHSSQLEKLILRFLIRNTITEFLKVDRQFKRHGSIKHLEIFEDEGISDFNGAIILKYCPELISINFDIYESLEYRHANELATGTFTQRYKIQKCFLKYNPDYGTNSADGSSYDGVRIAAVACPHLQDLKIEIRNNGPIPALSDFRNLTNLSILCRRHDVVPFTPKLKSLLEKPEIGRKLKSLDISHFSEVDFSSIGVCCPNLETLKVDYVTEISNGEYSPTSFPKLQLLRLMSNNDCANDTLLGILTNATSLKELTISPARSFTDDVLESVLKKNSLSELKILNLMNSAFSLHGWRQLAHSLTGLEYLNVLISNFSLQKLEMVIREVNPGIFVDWRVFR